MILLPAMPPEQTASWLGLLDLPVIDVRADPTMLATFTGVLTELGFSSTGISSEGLQHRWGRSEASIDVLLPDGIGERASLRHGVTGSPTLPTAGGAQALQRSETVAVAVDGRKGFVLRPNLVGALVGKAAALSNSGDPGLGRQRLRAMVAAVHKDRALLVELPDAEGSLIRLATAGEL